MRCPSCNSENPETTRFCGSCGRPLTKRCGKCGTENPAQFKFCGECGSVLIDPAISGAVADTAKRDRATDGVPEVPNRREGERRHLTVLFCDLVGSTALAAQLDPEEWRVIVADYHRTAAEAITLFGGYVAQYLGDGVMAYFGWPEAHDNDAERAARAGLAILDAIAKLNEQSGRQKLSARVGIDSGAVVVGASAGSDADVFGDAPNIAARVQVAAEPGTVLITDAVHRLVSGLFVVEDRGAQALKGIERPVQLYRVVQPSGVRGRLEAVAAARGLTPFVGREDELRLLLNRWERVLDGESQVALIIGEAGIGKSRLVQRFHEQIKGTLHTWVEAAAGPFFQNTPFYPVAEILHQLSAQLGNEPGRANVPTLREGNQTPTSLTTVRASNGHPANGASTKTQEQHGKSAPSQELDLAQELEITPQLTAAFLDLLRPGEYPLSSHQRRQLLSTLFEWVIGAARIAPLVIAIEDLHWADPSTLELIQLLAEQGRNASLLLLCTARPEFRPTWLPQTQITLSPLSAHNTRIMVEQVAGQENLPDEMVATVVERTGGVPLFVEELTRAVLEIGAAKLTAREIPVTLHDSLMARLDRLGPAKEVIQLGAVIGSDFSYELLREIHPVGEKELQSALQSLVDAQLLYVSGTAPNGTYHFKHALIRDTAYEALLKSRRKDLHKLLAHAIDEKFPTLKDTHPEVLARHWTEAGETEPAIEEWSRAGKTAEQRGAFREALENYQRAVSLLNELSQSGERDLRELDLRQSVVHMLWMTKGFSAPETVDEVNSAAALAEKTGNPNWLGAVWTSAYAAGDLRRASALADHAFEIANRKRDPVSLAGAYGLQLITRYVRGDLVGCEAHFADGLKFFEARFLPAPAAVVINLGIASQNAWLLGRADIARKRERLMLAAVNGNDPYEVVYSKFLAAMLGVLMREYERAETLAAGALALSEKHQLPYTAAVSRCVLGHARAELGRTADGIAIIRQGITSLLEAGTRLNIPYFTALLAVAQESKGAVMDALETIENALWTNPDELVCRPEIFRIRGELRLRNGKLEVAEADFRESIVLARSMGAKAWELRIAMSLARLLADQRRRDEARTMLAEIYGWFTEGFDTADLKDAKALLDQLNG